MFILILYPSSVRCCLILHGSLSDWCVCGQVEAYYMSSAAGHARVVFGNRRWGNSGYVAGGRQVARPAQPARTKVSSNPLPLMQHHILLIRVYESCSVSKSESEGMLHPALH